MGNQIAIVTGASSGFGLLTTIELARSGYDVIATMRNMDKASNIKTVTRDEQVLERIHVHQLDVTDTNSIEKLREKVSSLNRVDVLVNNAGFGMGGFAEEVTLDAYRRQFETNVFGVMAVTQAVLPKMREQGTGKIIQISSVSGRIGFPGLSPYVSSKHALEGYSESLRIELRPFGIQVALVEPGSYKTNIWSSGMAIEGQYGQTSPYQKSIEGMLSILESSKSNHGDPAEVAQLICTLAIKKDIKKLRYPIGKGLKATLLLKGLLPWRWWEKAITTVIKKNNK